MTVSRPHRIIALIAAGWFCASVPGWAVEPSEILPDPALEHRARQLSAELRCLVCQNQSIDDSNAPLARDLRLLVRERLQAGDSDAAVRTYVVARYGDFVLLKPPLNVRTLLLWLAPLLCLAGLSYALLRASGRFGAAGPGYEAAKPLDAGEEQRLAELLASGETRSALPTVKPVERPR